MGRARPRRHRRCATGETRDARPRSSIGAATASPATSARARSRSFARTRCRAPPPARSCIACCARGSTAADLRRRDANDRNNARTSTPTNTPARPGSRASSKRAASIASSACKAAISSRSGTTSRAQGIRIIDVRDEGAAVHMAHAHAELTGGFGVAMVTAGPGVTNTVTAMANASLARAPVLLIGGCTSRPQANMGPLQDIPHVDLLRPVCRACAHVARRRPGDPRIRRGGGARHGRRRRARTGLSRDSDRRAAHPCAAAARARGMAAGEAAARAAARSRRGRRRRSTCSGRAKRPLVITGRGAREAGAALVRLLDATGALYLDTQESRGLVPADHPSTVGRGARRRHERGGRGAADRAQARLSGRLWLAGGVSRTRASSASPTTPANSSTTAAASPNCWLRPTSR